MISTVQRVGLVAGILALEALLIFVHVRDDERSAIARWSICCACVFAAFAYTRFKVTVESISRRAGDGARYQPISYRFVAGHAGAMTLLLLLASPALVHSISGAASTVVLAAWVLSGFFGIVFAATAFLPVSVWLIILRNTGNAGIYALAGGTVASLLSPYLWRVWDRFLLKSVIAITFAGVKLLIGPLLPDFVADPATLAIGSRKFEITLGGACSGWEGVGLAFVFTVVWLWVCRTEFRFPRALLLVPAACLLMFALNIVRVAALILIGNAGAARIAMSGFHSQAGWIAFNAVVLGIAVVTPRIEWLARFSVKPSSSGEQRLNPAIPYLLPFAAILAAGMLSRAASDGFEWLYPVRFFAALTALWFGRRAYASLDWRPGWLSFAAGTAVFALWIAVDGGTHPDSAIPSGLAALPAPAATAWIFFRTLAAVTTVPIAEELAFRGFLLRRFVSAEFETVAFRRFTWPAVIASSILFGLLHGDRWIAGTIAGAVYAAVMLRRGRIGDAAAAHATTNFLLAVTVLWRHAWHLW